jgi:hypothetical protein
MKNIPNLTRYNVKDVEMFVAADSISLFFGKAEFKNPFAYTHSCINYQMMNCRDRNRITEKFEEALEEFAGAKKEEWGNYHCDIYYAENAEGPSIIVDAGFFRMKIHTNKKGHYFIRYI